MSLSSSDARTPEVDALAALSDPRPSDALWSRIEASDRAGVRPAANPFAVPDTPLDADLLEPEPIVARAHGVRWTQIAAAAASLGIAWFMLRPATALEAGMISGAMELTPANPKVGERVRVRYTAGSLLGRPATLRLRARVRTVHDDDYVTNQPVITLGSLSRATGSEYTGSFVLPDSFVYAALAVEDTAARDVDDFGGRTWEVLRAAASGEPSLAALVQRTNDLMGRSWEAGLAGVRRMIALYPDSVRSWRWLHSYESWMSMETDSTRAVHRRQLARFTARDLHRSDLSPDAISDAVWYARTLDSASAARWLARLQSEAPQHSTSVYMRLLTPMQALWAQQRDSLSVLRDFEAAWATAPADRRVWMAEYGSQLSRRDSSAAARWSERLLQVSVGLSARRSAAQQLLDLPGQRARGEAALRQLLQETTTAREPRRLDESTRDHLARVERSRRATLSVLGQALAQDGQLIAARDTLEQATTGGWEVAAFGSLGDVRLALGDTSGALDAWAHVAVDPRTPASRLSAFDSTARRLRHGSTWLASLRTARGVLSARVLERAINRHVDEVQLHALDGTARSLSSLRGPQATVVLFWSHECAYAVEALPELQALAARFTARGIPFVMIADAARVTPELTATLNRSKVSLPVYLDATGAATATFNNWGTPTLYVLDAKGRVAFPGTNVSSDVLLYAEAVSAMR